MKTVDGHSSVLAGGLVDAYLSTTYLTQDTSVGPVALKIGAVCTELAKLYAAVDLAAGGGKGTAFITAFNPFGLNLPAEQNEARHEMLRGIITKNQWTAFEGYGVGDDHQDWEPEKSFLILGIDRRTASDIGLVFQQNAIVVSGCDVPAKLILLR